MSKEVPRTPITIDINAFSFPAIQTEQTKGKNAGETIVVLDFPSDDATLYDNFRSAIGEANFLATLFREVIKPACYEASDAAFDEKTGEIEQSKFLTALSEYFLPASRKSSGPSKADLQKQQAEVMSEITPYFAKFQSGTITDEEKLVMSRLITEMEDIATKIEAKGRKGKKPAVAAATEAAH